MEAKPILLIKVNYKSLSGTININDIWKAMEERFFDYHVLCMIGYDMEEMIELKVYNIKDATELTIGILKQEIKTALDGLNRDRR